MFGQVHGPKFDFIIKHWKKFGRVPTKELFFDTFTNSEEVHCSEPVDFYIENIREQFLFNKVRNIRDLINNSVEKVSASEVMDSVLAIARESLVKTKPLSDIDISATIDNRLKSYENDVGRHEEIIGYRTGIPPLDNVIGGFRDGELVTVHARPGNWKSFLLLLMAVNIWKGGARVLFISREMPPEQLVKRIDALLTSETLDYTQKGFPDFGKFKQFSKELIKYKGKHEFIITAAVGGGFTIDSVRTKIKEVGPDIAFVDGAYLIQIPGHRGADWERLAGITREIKQMALTEDIPIIQTTQTGRGKKGEDFHSRDKVGYSDTFLQDSDILLHLQRGYDKKEKRLTKILTVSYDKTRESEEGRAFYQKWEFSPLSVESSEDPEIFDIGYNLDILDNEEEYEEVTEEEFEAQLKKNMSKNKNKNSNGG